MEKFKNLYIKTSHITEEAVLKIPDLELLPIFLDIDLRSRDCVRGFYKTAIHFPILGPSSKIFSEFYGGFIDETKFRSEYFEELLLKDFRGIFQRLDFLRGLSNAVGIVLMDGISYPKYVDHLADFLNLCGFFNNKIDELKLD